ncbi:NAD(P)/FAD-dependent oxidoreductase [Legionella birminghamensis]|uniref:NAD(P)/FAD-dependent oxidoreductase n=1 Tax=Legionella birminghamensis TaxID=28083 RepID=UPI0007318AD1|nr:NAD(P)/FAD-dependent oxidoreductase [Legionella birminghamensis]
MNKVDVIIVGAGAAGMMCAMEAGARGRKVLILDKSNKPGKKILMSGGGRCNFTNLYASPEQFISHNPHFCKSALKRYTQWDFIELVKRHKIAFYEKTAGQLFCEEKSHLIVEMLLAECRKNKVDIRLNHAINSIIKKEDQFIVSSDQGIYQSDSLVIASGGLSIPTLGSSPFGYQVAAQFGLNVYPTRAGLVPFTLHEKDKEQLAELTGISIESSVSCNNISFQENVLFTHRGLSGPAILQISSYWLPGQSVEFTFLPQIDLYEELMQARQSSPDIFLKTLLSRFTAKRVLDVFYKTAVLEKPLKQFNHKELQQIAQRLQAWSIKPNATEGYRTAEVTLGGVDCDEISSQTFEAKKVPGLYFIGEVLDVAGWLGGYNFQWAWSSGWAAGQVV